ncbi:MAG: biopolymer transporter ExbD [Kiritimatiellia bacterium]|nr:biopolymer transporter ExbD [Kiritimatiellia bacterium]
MSRFHRTESEESESGIDISPLIDCIFILLLFFIVTTTFVEETGVEVDKPQAASSVKLDKNSLLLAITSAGEVVYAGQDIGVGGVRPLVKRMIEKEDLPVILQTDKSVPAGLLVRVIDETKLAGATRVNLATRKGEE